MVESSHPRGAPQGLEQLLSPTLRSSASPSMGSCMLFVKNQTLWALMVAAALSCTPSKESAPEEKTAQKPKNAPQNKAVKCPTSGIPVIEAIYTAEGVTVWELGQPFPKKNRFYDAIEIRGQNLCSGKLTMADGFSPAKPLSYSVLPSGNIKIPIPWELERITQSILFRTEKSFSRIDFHFVPIDKVTRQIFVRGMKGDVFR